MKGRTPRILNFLLALALLAGTFAVAGGPPRVAEAKGNNNWDVLKFADSPSFAVGTDGNYVFGVAFSPTYATDGTLFALATKTGTGVTVANTYVLRSTDRGYTWTLAADFTSTAPDGSASGDTVLSIKVAQNSNLVLFIKTTAGQPLIYISTDSGSSFRKHSVDISGTTFATTPSSQTVALNITNAGLWDIAPTFPANGRVVVAVDTGSASDVLLYDNTTKRWDSLGAPFISGGGTNKAGVLGVGFAPDYATSNSIWAVGGCNASTTCSGNIATAGVYGQRWKDNAWTVQGTNLSTTVISSWTGGRLVFDSNQNPWFAGTISAGSGTGGMWNFSLSTWLDVTSPSDASFGSNKAVGDLAIVSGAGSTARVVYALRDPTSATITKWTSTGGTVPSATGQTAWRTTTKDPGDVKGSQADIYRPVVASPDGNVWVGNQNGGTGARGGLFMGRFLGTDFAYAHMGITTLSASSITASSLSALEVSPQWSTDHRVFFADATEGVFMAVNVDKDTAAKDISYVSLHPRASVKSIVPSSNYAADTTIYIAADDTNGGTNAAFRSFNGGIIWETMKTSAGDGFPTDTAVIRKLVSPASGTAIAITDDTSRPVSVSLNHGDTWVSRGAESGLNISDARDISVSGKTVAVVGLGGGQIQVYVSQDSGSTWARVGTKNLGGGEVQPRVNVSPNYANDGVIIAGVLDNKNGTDVASGLGDIYRSVKGADWVRLDTASNLASCATDVSTDIGGFAAVSTPANRLYMVDGAGGLKSLSNYVTAGGGTGLAGTKPTSATSLPGTWQGSGSAGSTGTGPATTTTGKARAPNASGLTGKALIATTKPPSGDAPTVFVAGTDGTTSGIWRLTDLGSIAPAPSNPADGTAYTDLTNIILNWSTVTGADSNSVVELNVSKDKGFPNCGVEVKTGVMNQGTIGSWKLGSGTGTPSSTTSGPTLERGYTYYWRVRMTHGVFSTVRSFVASLLRPILSRPENGTQVNTLQPFFAWKNTGLTQGGNEEDLQADRYAFELSTDSGFTKDKSQRVEFAGIQLSYQPEKDLVPGGTYYWRVQGAKVVTAADGKVTTTWSAYGGPYSFQTPAGPAAPPAPVVPVGPAKVVDVFKAIVADVTIVWFFDAKTQGWKKYDPKAPAFVSDLVDLAPDEVVLIIAAKDIKAFKIGSRTYDLVKGNNYKAYIP